MGCIFKKQNKLWARFKDETGKWTSAPTPYRPGDEARADQFLQRLETQLEALRKSHSNSPDVPLTVAIYAREWLAERASLRLASHMDDVCRINKHVLPRLGALRVDEVRPSHIRRFVLALRTETTLAPRTLHHIYQLTACMFRTAVADELIDVSPCVLPRGTLPKKADKDPTWRATAIFERGEVEQLISDPRIPEARRVLYALKGVAGLRHGEAAGLRWRQLDGTLTPLGAISLSHTKTKVPRRVPVHPTLALLLADWLELGWQRTYGRPPTMDDLVVPTSKMTVRTTQEAPKQLREDLDHLGLRRRRGHDLRRTFITLAQVDGARRDLLETVTHGPRGDIVSVYTTFPWPALCEEVAKLRVSLREGKVLDGTFGATPTPSVLSAPGFATAPASNGNYIEKSVTPSGIEPERNSARLRENGQAFEKANGNTTFSRSLEEFRRHKLASQLPGNALRNLKDDRAGEALEHLAGVVSAHQSAEPEGARSTEEESGR